MSPNPADSQIFSVGSVILRFSSTAALSSDTSVQVTLPEYMADTSYSYIQTSVNCQGVSNTGTAACTYTGASKELRITGVVPSAGLASGTVIEVKINGFLMPPSTSLYSGFKISLLNGNNQRFNREDNVTLLVVTPKTISNMVSTLPNNTVGHKGKLFFTIVLPAPVITNSVLKLTFTNLNIAGCNLVSSLGLFSSNCSSLTVTSQLLADQTLTLILENVVNNQETVNGTALVQIFDASDKISMNSSLVQFAFAEHTIFDMRVTGLPANLGATGKLQAEYKTQVGYKSGAKFKITVPTQVVLPAPVQCYYMGNLIACSNSGSVVSFTTSSAVAVGSTINIQMDSVALPPCNGNYNLLVQIESVESGSKNLESLAVGVLAGSSIVHNSTNAWTDAEYNIRITYPSNLFKDAEIRVALPNGLLWQSSTTCTVAGLDGGTTCALEGSNSLKISGATGTIRVPGGSFDLTIKNFTNPRLKGSYPLSLSVISSCIYMSGSFNLNIAQSAQWNSVTLTPNKPYLSTYHSIDFSVTPPRIPHSGDKVVITSSPTLETTSSSAKSGLEYTQSASLKHFLSPASSSTVNFNVMLVDSSGATLLNTLKTISYEGNLPGKSSANFGSLEKGKRSNITTNISVDSYLPPQSKIEISLSSNFSDISSISLISSHPEGTIQVDSAKQTITFNLAKESQPNETIILNLALTNPQVSEISVNEIMIGVLTNGNIQMFSALPLTSSIKFICAVGCLSCDKLSTNCKTCQEGFVLRDENKCVDKKSLPILSTSKTYPPIFIFPIMSLIAGTICLVLRKLSKISHPWNLTFYINRTLFFCWLIVSLSLFFALLGSTQGAVALIIFVVSITMALGSSCIDKPSVKAEKISWLTGVGANRWGVVGFGKDSEFGWRNPKGMESFDNMYRPNSDAYSKWKKRNTIFCAIAVIAVNIPSVAFGIVFFVSNPSFYLALEMVIMSCIDIFFFILAWIELNSKDAKALTKSSNSLLKKNKAGNKYSHSVDDDEDPERDPRGLSKKRANDDSQANLLDDTAKVMLYPAIKNHELDLPLDRNETNGNESNMSDIIGEKFRIDEELGQDARIPGAPMNFKDQIDGKKPYRKFDQPPNSDLNTDRLAYGLNIGSGDSDGEYQDSKDWRLLHSDLLKIEGLENLTERLKNADSDEKRKILDELKAKRSQSTEAHARLIENFVKKYASEENLLNNSSQEDRDLGYEKYPEGKAEKKHDGRLGKKDTRDLDNDELNQYNKNRDNTDDSDSQYNYFDPISGIFQIKNFDEDESKKPKSKFITELRKMPLVPSKGINMLELKEYIPNRTVEDSSGNIIDPSKIPLHRLKKDKGLRKLGYCVDKRDPQIALKNTPMNTVPVAPSSTDKEKPLSLVSRDTTDYNRRPFNDASLESSHMLIYPSSRTIVDEGGIAQANRFWKNQLRNRLNCSPYYLEVIYEETDEDNGRPRVAENPIYDNPILERLSQKMAGIQGQMKAKNLPENVKQQMIKELVSMVRQGKVSPEIIAKRSEEVGIGGLGHLSTFLKSTDLLEVNEKLEPEFINGQKYQDFADRNIHFIDGRYLPLEDQDPELLERGIYKDNFGEEMYLGPQDPQNIRRGLIVNPAGETIQIAKLRAADLIQDVWRKPETGEVAFVNGQPAETASKLVLVDKNGEKVNIRKQDRKAMMAGKLITESGNIIDLGCPQDKTLLEKGLVLSKDGVVRRIADNSWTDINKPGTSQTIGRSLDTGKFIVDRDEDNLELVHLKDSTPEEIIEFERKKAAKKEKFKDFFDVNDPAVVHKEKMRVNEKRTGENWMNPHSDKQSKANTVGDDEDQLLRLKNPKNKRIGKKYEMSEGQIIDSKASESHMRRDNLSNNVLKPDRYNFNNKADQDLMSRIILPRNSQEALSLKKIQDNQGWPGRRPDSPGPEMLTVNLVNEQEDSFDLSVNVQEGNDRIEGNIDDTQSRDKRTVDGSKYHRINDGSTDELKSEFNFTGMDIGFKRDLYKPDNLEELKHLQTQKRKVEDIAKRHLGLGGKGQNELTNIMGVEDNGMDRANRTSNTGS